LNKNYGAQIKSTNVIFQKCRKNLKEANREHKYLLLKNNLIWFARELITH